MWVEAAVDQNSPVVPAQAGTPLLFDKLEEKLGPCLRRDDGIDLGLNGSSPLISVILNAIRLKQLGNAEGPDGQK
jgi:hypothetical protein